VKAQRAAPPRRPAHRRRRTWTGSFRAAGVGVVEAWRRGPNFRLQVAAAYLVAVAAWRLRLPPAELGLLALAAAAVLAAEAANTAVEVLVDLVTRDPHPLARLAKDLAAGAVLLAAAGAVAVGAAVFGPQLGRLPAAAAAQPPLLLAGELLLAAGLLLLAVRP
jgi:diacylglycerol kinase